MDCCFTRDNHWFRYRACAIIPSGDSILMVTNPKVDYYYSVGGGVMLGESAEMPSGGKCWRKPGLRWR